MKNKGVFAMKEFRLNDEEFVKSFEIELNILRHLKHENIAVLVGYVIEPSLFNFSCQLTM